MPVLATIKPKRYQDSVRLMRLSEVLSGLAHVKQATVAMGTDANKRVLAEVGLVTAELERAGANDLMIVVDAESETAAGDAITEAERRLTDRDSSSPTSAPPAPPKPRW